MISSSMTLADISQRYYAIAKTIEPNAMPAPGSIAVEPAPDIGRGNLVDTYA